MFIIDFRNKLVSDNHFSVMGNNNVDVVHFYSHFTQYASGYNVYLKILGNDETYVDKILIDSENISIEDDVLLVKWTMGEVSTQCKKIDVQLQFENNDGSIVAQTRIVSITLGDTIDVDGEIAHIYPKVLTQLQEQIDTLKGESVKGVGMSYASDTLIIKLYNKDNVVIATNQVSIPLSNKLDRVSETNKVYGTNANGVNIRYPIASDVEAFSIPIRNIGGALRVPLLPTHAQDSVSKNYVDSRIDEIEQRSDVVDVVGTYAELEAYDTSHLAPNSLIKVINDETHDNEITYYRWVITDDVGAWTYVASEGAYYTTAQIDLMLANYYTKQEADTNVPKKQMSASVIIDPTTNLNGYSVGYPTGYKATLVSGTYPYYHITNKEDDSELTIEQASDYIRRMSGTYFVPTYIEDTPRYSLWITATGQLLKPQYHTEAGATHKMRLYLMPNPFALKTDIANLDTIFNPNEASAGTEIKWTKMLSFSKSADTTFTFETAKTGCLNEYKAILTNSGNATITITLPSGTTINTNDDNIVISSNTFTLASGVSVELSCVNSNCIVYNFNAQ